MLNYFLTLSFAFAMISNALSATINTACSSATGDSITVWDDSTPSGFNIFASYQTGGSWSSSVTIANPATSPQNPLTAINSSGNGAAVWIGVDTITFARAIYGSFYDRSSNSWSVPTVLTNLATEFPYDDYQVFISDTDQVIATWSGYITTIPDVVARAVSSTSFGTWGATITIP